MPSGLGGAQPSAALPCARCSTGHTRAHPNSEFTKNSARMEDRRFHMLTSSWVGCEIKNYPNTHPGVNKKTFSEGNWIWCLHKLGAKQLCTQVNAKGSWSAPLWAGDGFGKGIAQWRSPAPAAGRDQQFLFCWEEGEQQQQPLRPQPLCLPLSQRCLHRDFCCILAKNHIKSRILCSKWQRYLQRLNSSILEEITYWGRKKEW